MTHGAPPPSGEKSGGADGPGDGKPKRVPRRRIVDGGFLFITLVGIAAALATWWLRGPEIFVAVLGDDI